MARDALKAVCITLGALMLVAGCVSTPTRTVIPNEVAFMKVKTGDVSIGLVDGSSAEKTNGTVYVPPGIHDFWVEEFRDGKTWSYFIKVHCEKGHTYVLEPQLVAGRMAVRDTTTDVILRGPKDGIFSANPAMTRGAQAISSAPPGSLVVPPSALPPGALQPATAPARVP